MKPLLRPSTRSVAVIAEQAILVVAPVYVLLRLILLRCEGSFAYSLDDPYIHLALARNIWHGTYGINPGEFAAPSSSILWPFLLAPFSMLGPYFEWVPLTLNVVALSLSVVCLDRIFAALSFGRRLVVLAALLLACNLYGLVFTGMEHSLQVLLVLVILVDLTQGMDFADYRQPSWLVFAALVTLPLVRYEGLAISIPVLGLYLVRGDRKAATISATVLLLVMGAFSLFIHRSGVGFLPSSVVSRVVEHRTFLNSIFPSLSGQFREYGFLFPVVAWLVWRLRKRSRPLAAVLATATLLQFCVGRSGAFGRYEVYLLIVLAVVYLRLVFEGQDRPNVAFALVLPLLFQALTMTTIQTPAAAENIYSQQEQLGRLANTLARPVAVNDLGNVAFRSGNYVLDIWGLGNAEALRNRLSGANPAGWIGELMRRHQVHYAFIYADWFHYSLPRSWVRVGTLSILHQAAISASRLVVSLYATRPEDAPRLRAAIISEARSSTGKDFLYRW